jgi:hypothetical protein
MNQVAGSIRFNTDSNKLEIYNGNQWWEIDATSPDLQTGGTRGFISGGGTPSQVNIIEFANINSTGNLTNFGDLNNRVNGPAGSADRTRGITSGGYQSPSNAYINNIDFITMASTGDASNFGDLTVRRGYSAGGSNSTRGLTGGAWSQTPSPGNSDVIDYITIQSTGDAIDFGNLTQAKQVDAAVNSPTRVVFTGGCTGPSPTFAVPTSGMLDYVTTSTLGNAADFGDLHTATFGNGAASNSIRGLIMGGNSNPTKLNSIQFITIATLGNALDFGDSPTTHYYCASCASPTRAIVAGGSTPSTINDIDYVQIMTTGNGLDFGDLSSNRDQMTGFSNGHGGLG